MRKTFKYRLYPNKQQLEECRWLYNELLAARRDAWEQRQESLRLYDQQATLPALKAARPTLAGVQSQVLQNVAVRIDLAFQAFFRRVRAGEKPGYPRFRGQGRYDSITFPQVPVGCKLDAETKRLRIANVGLVKIILHRPLEGAPKTATISRSSTGKWYVCFSCECAEPSPLPATGQQVGIDVGLKTFATPQRRAGDCQPALLPPRGTGAGEDSAPPLARKSRAHLSAPSGAAWWRGCMSALPGGGATSPISTAAASSNGFDLIAVEDLSVNRMTHIPIVSPRASRTPRGVSSQPSSPTRQHGPVGSMSL